VLSYVSTPSFVWSNPRKPGFCSIRCNVSPWVERRTPWRDDSTVWTSEVSRSQVYEVILNVSLFYNHFSLQKTSQQQVITAMLAMQSFVSLGLMIDASAPPPASLCLEKSLRSSGRSKKIPPKKDITPSLIDTLPSRTYIPEALPGRRRPAEVA
jgi:hypothetical protein